jgi:Ca-activated chloride channel family protein
MTPRTLYPLSTWTVWVLWVPLLLIVLWGVLVAITDDDTLLFDNPGLWWMGAVGLLAGLMTLYGVARRRRAMMRFASAELLPMLAARISPVRQAIRASLIVVAVLFVTVALTGPRWGVHLDKQTVYGVDVVVALDVSRSMLARDAEPNRLLQAKQEIRRQLTERAVFRRANRLALLAFAGSTSLRLPLTTDHSAFRSKLAEVATESAPRGGTAIAEAIRASTDLFARSPEEATKIILLFTDGEDHEGGPVEAARAAFEEHRIRTFAIGVGDPVRTVGVQVPISADDRKPLLYDGQIVFSKLDVSGLQQISEAGGGQFVLVDDLHRLVDGAGNDRQRAANGGRGRGATGVAAGGPAVTSRVLPQLLAIVVALPVAHAKSVMPEVGEGSGLESADGSSPGVTESAEGELSGLSASRAVRRGNEQLMAGQPARALEAYRFARQLDPEAREIAFVQGLAHYDLEEFDKARDAFRKVVALADDGLTDDALYSLGVTDHREALETLEVNPQLALSLLENAMRRYHDVLAKQPDHRAARDANFKAASMWRDLNQRWEQKQQRQDQGRDPSERRNVEQAQEVDEPGHLQKIQQQGRSREQPERQFESDTTRQLEDLARQWEARAAKQKQVSREQAERRLREMMQAVRDRKRARRQRVQEAPIAPVDKDW